MPVYQCHFTDKKSNKSNDYWINAISVNEAYEKADKILKDSNLQVLFIKKNKISKITKIIINDKVLSMWFYQVYFLIKNKVPIIYALRTVNELSFPKAMKDISSKIIKSLEDGESLYFTFSIFEDVFTDEGCHVIKMCESTGNILRGFEILHEMFDSKEKIKNQIYDQIKYPCFLFIISTVIIYLLKTSVLPVFIEFLESTSSNKSIPDLVFWFNEISFLNIFFVIIFFSSICFFLFALGKSSRKIKKANERIVSLIPFFGNIVKKYHSSKFFNRFSMLLYGNVSVIKSLEILEKSTKYETFRFTIKNLIDDLRCGGDIIDFFNSNKSNEFSNSTKILIQSSGVHGCIRDSIKLCAIQEKDNFDKSLQKSIQVIQPICIFFISAIIFTIIICLVNPIYDHLAEMDF